MSNSEKEETDLDEEAARRPRDFYLNPTPTPPELQRPLWTLREGVTGEQANEHAMASAALRGSHRTGNGRPSAGHDTDVVFALMHMVNMARALLEQRKTTEQGAIEGRT
jgi:hypothetical protein